MRRRAAGEGSMEKRRDAKGRGREKSCCSFGFCPNEGGGRRALSNFWHLFITAFLVNKRSPRYQ